MSRQKRSEAVHIEPVRCAKPDALKRCFRGCRLDRIAKRPFCCCQPEKRPTIDRRLDQCRLEGLFGYMDAAARIKPDRQSIRDERRKAEVIANVKAHAAELGMPAPLAAAMWEMLIESSISYEMIQFDRRED